MFFVGSMQEVDAISVSPVNARVHSADGVLSFAQTGQDRSLTAHRQCGVVAVTRLEGFWAGTAINFSVMLRRI